MIRRYGPPLQDVRVADPNRDRTQSVMDTTPHETVQHVSRFLINRPDWGVVPATGGGVQSSSGPRPPCTEAHKTTPGPLAPKWVVHHCSPWVWVGNPGGRRRRRRSYGPLTHSDVGRKSKSWSPVTPLVSTVTSLSGVQGTVCPRHPTLCPGHGHRVSDGSRVRSHDHWCAQITSIPPHGVDGLGSGPTRKPPVVPASRSYGTIHQVPKRKLYCPGERAEGLQRGADAVQPLPSLAPTNPPPPSITILVSALHADHTESYVQQQHWYPAPLCTTATV